MAYVTGCGHMNHINALVEDFDAMVERYSDLYGAQFNLDMPGEHWHACLMTIGGVMFQFMAPHQYILNARMGPHYFGIEYVVPDVDKARDEVFARGLRIVRELDVAFHMHPVGAYGVAWEMFGKSFQDRENPPVAYPEPIWEDETFAAQPMGWLGLKRYSMVAGDLAGVSDFITGFLGATESYEEDRPHIGAKAKGFAFADTVLEVLVPTGEGVIKDFHARYGDGLRSTVFQVKDLAAATAHLASKGVTLRDGDAPGVLAIAAEDNEGLIFEFSE
jgi:catechol 2,3-dioxygenase-like lactoylglutathione lyase family enzyme